MKAAPTLLDHIYRASYGNERVAGWTNNAKWRTALYSARRFVLDDNMSTFMGELGTQAFVVRKTAALRNIIIENLRLGARLPYPTTWIEYNLRNCQIRSNELLNRPFDPLETPQTEGWLLQQHPHLETAFIAHVITHSPDLPDDYQFDTWTFPVAMAWTADMDTVLPWPLVPLNEKGMSASECAAGLIGYKSDKCGYVFSDMIDTPRKPAVISKLMSEWSGVLRRMWALLATIADLPVQMGEVRQAKGFMAKGNYRKFLDHKTLTLTVPQKEHRKIARNALALAHRRGGPVRAHFRKDWRHPLSPLCEHEFSGDERHMICLICKGRKIHVKAHERGDSSRGFATLDYKITHDPAVQKV